MQPRSPTQAELNQLWQWMKQEQHDEMYVLDETTWAEQFCIVVFDGYMTCGPGYAGRLMYLIWDATPDCCDVFTWKNGKLTHYATHGDHCSTHGNI